MNEFHEQPRITIGVVEVTPFLTAEQMEAATSGAEAVILVTFASGTAPERLVPVVQAKTNAEVPVFLLSNNPKDEHGILKITYGSQDEFRKAGAIALQSVNINNVDEVLAAIEEESKQGKHGRDLAETIENRFRYQEGKTKIDSE